AVVVLDQGLHVRIWSEKAEDFWGLRREEAVGQPFTDLDIGLPVRELDGPLRDALTGKAEQQVTLDGVNRRGRTTRFQVRCTPLTNRKGVEGVVVLAEEADQASDAF
ncbi:MAG: PAS domain-containing protein, partial [Thermoanaerobaculia bacterium]